MREAVRQRRVLITGAGGQLGRELTCNIPDGVELAAVSRQQLDIADEDGVATAMKQYRPDLVINAAAYTAVDRAESEPELAYRVNGAGPAVLAAACAAAEARLVHVSTDFVFDGTRPRPWRPDDATAPLGVYGHSKLAGEKAVQTALPGALIVRTSWVYSRFGGNFVRTMLRLMAQKEELSIVVDQAGSPTWAAGLAQTLWRAADSDESGILHWSDAGICSWYDFARAIAEESLALGLLERIPSLRPIATSDYPTPARRPAYSVLDTTLTHARLELPWHHWREQLRGMLADLRDSTDE